MASIAPSRVPLSPFRGSWHTRFVARPTMQKKEVKSMMRLLLVEDDPVIQIVAKAALGLAARG